MKKHEATMVAQQRVEVEHKKDRKERRRYRQLIDKLKGGIWEKYKTLIGCWFSGTIIMELLQYWINYAYDHTNFIYDHI